jgi:hypothetical protein
MITIRVVREIIQETIEICDDWWLMTYDHQPIIYFYFFQKYIKNIKNIKNIKKKYIKKIYKNLLCK